MQTIKRSIRTFTGSGSLHGKRFVVLSVHRRPNDVILEDDAEVGKLRPDDVVEIAQIVGEADGRERLTWVTCDAQPHELGRAEGVWRRSIATGIVVRALDPLRN